MKRFLAFILAIITVLGLFAGCAEEKEPAANNNNTDDTATPGDAVEQDEVRIYDNIVQEALCVVAEAYYIRRTTIQYEDNPLIKSGGILRADRHKYSPEDATKQFTTYTNCAAFTYDVYKEALGIDILSWTTSSLQSAADMHVLTCNEALDSSEKEEWKQKIMDNLQPGDIINYRVDGWGHAMLYVGYDEVIHCSSNFGTGGSYNMASNKEVLDPSGGIYKVSLSDVFGKHDILGADQFAIVRPTLRYTEAQPTEKTLNRIANLKNIKVEKTSSHTVGMTAPQGCEVTFTFTINNNNKTERTIEVIDTVPANTTYVSGADTVEGTTLKWSVTIPASSKKEVSYTVKVNADAKTGDKIASVATVGGVDVRCRDIYIGGALTAEQQAKIGEEAAKIKGGSVSGIELAKQVYAAAGIACDIGTAEEIINSMFKSSKKASGHFELNRESEYMSMLAPTMYGGYLVYTDTTLYDGNRTKAPMISQLMAGDIIICKEGSVWNLFMFVGNNKVMNLNSGSQGVLDLAKTVEALYSTIGHDQFVIIRPAMGK